MIPALLSFDVEPDGYFLDPSRPAPWRGFELALPFARALRERLTRVSGRPARFNWLLRMDPQVERTYGSADWVAREHRGAFDELEAWGDEFGLHVHAYRWDAGARGWLIDHGNQAHVDHCLQLAADSFTGAFGRPARSFRFGDRWMNDATLARLEALGIRHDLTVEPGHLETPSYHPDEPFTGSLPDTRRAPRTPYQPSIADFCVPATPRPEGLWIIPVTTAPVRPRITRLIYYRLARPERLGVSWNALLSHDPVLFARIIDWNLRRPDLSHLSIVLRTQALAGPPIVRRIQQNLEWLLARPQARRLAWTTPDAVVHPPADAPVHPAGAAARA